jgi:cysteinyl-tRNA synthetase
MGKSEGNFLRLQTLIDLGYDPLAWRFFCLSAHYRAKQNFAWDALDGAATALNRLRRAAHEWGAPGSPDPDWIDRFTAQVNDDLNMPRALAVTWELVRCDLPDTTKKATLLTFDRVLGLRLAEWQPPAAAIPDEVQALAEQRQQARKEKRWQDADALREQIREAGYEIEDTAEGPRLRPHTGAAAA